MKTPKFIKKGPKVYICQRCQHEFPRISKLETHEKTCQFKTIKCILCSKMFKNYKSLQVHQNKIHKILFKDNNPQRIPNRKLTDKLSLPIKSDDQPRIHSTTEEAELQKRTFYSIDFETTGLSTDKKEFAEIVQYSIHSFTMEDRDIIHVKSKTFNHEHKMNKDAFACHGLKPEYLKTFEIFKSEDAQFIINKVHKSKGLIAHNIHEDIAIFKSVLKRLKCDKLFGKLPPLYCTQNMARTIMYVNTNLKQTCLQVFDDQDNEEIEAANWHDATTDSFYHAQLFYVLEQRRKTIKGHSKLIIDSSDTNSCDESEMELLVDNEY